MKFLLFLLPFFIGCQPKKLQEQHADKAVQILEEQLNRKLSILPITHLANHTLITIENEKVSLKELILGEILILRIPFVSCQVCRENELSLLKQFFPSKTHKTALIISAERNRDFFLFNRINQIEQPVFKFPTQELFTEWDKYGKPYALLLDRELKIITVHFPLLEFPHLSETFYQNIAVRFQNDQWNFQASLNEKIALQGMVVKPSKFWKETFGRGIIINKNILQVTAPISGYLKNWNYDKDQSVNKGDLLGTLALESQESKFLQLQFNLKKSRGAFEKRLIQLGYQIADSSRIPPSIWEAAQLNTGYSETLNQMQHFHEELDKSQIWSPSKGKLKNILVHPGQRIQVGQPIAEIVLNQEKYIQANLLKYQIEKIKIGDVLQLTEQPQLKGKVTHIGSNVDEDGTVMIKATLPPNQLLAGEKVNFKILSNPILGICIPRTSLFQKNGKFSVYTYQQRPILKEIFLSEGNEDFVLVQSGLSFGDTIITNPDGYLNDYQIVNLTF